MRGGPVPVPGFFSAPAGAALHPPGVMTASAPAPTLAPKSGNYRWRICAILFIATTINYVDRNVLSFTMLDDGFRRVMLDLPAGAPLGAAEIALFKEKMGYGDAAFKFA